MSPRLLIPPRPTSSDAQLARRAAAGDDDSFAALYARYEPRLYAYCRSIVRHDEDAHDAVQNAMTKALVALRRDANTINVQAWLFRIAHNESITVLRRRKPTSELPDAVCDHALDPAGDVIVREELRATLEGVRALPGRLQQPLLLRELAGLSYGQVAEVTGGTPAAARKAVFEARSALSADRQGRDEACSVIRQALSDGDGRRRRARIVRSHLRSCDACRSWEHELRARREHLAGTIPAAGIAAGSLWGWLGGIFGGGAGSTAAVGLTGGVATNVKLAAAVLVVAAGATTPVVTKHDGSSAGGAASGAVVPRSSSVASAARTAASGLSTARAVVRASGASVAVSGFASAAGPAASERERRAGSFADRARGGRTSADAASASTARRERPSARAGDSGTRDGSRSPAGSPAPTRAQAANAGAAPAPRGGGDASGASGASQPTASATADRDRSAHGATTATAGPRRDRAGDGTTAAAIPQLAERLPAAPAAAQRDMLDG